MSPVSHSAMHALLMANLDVGLIKMAPNVGKQRPGLAQSISTIGAGMTPTSIRIATCPTRTSLDRVMLIS